MWLPVVSGDAEQCDRWVWPVAGAVRAVSQWEVGWDAWDAIAATAATAATGGHQTHPEADQHSGDVQVSLCVSKLSGCKICHLARVELMFINVERSMYE